MPQDHDKQILTLIQRACSKHSDPMFFEAVQQAQQLLEMNETIYNNIWGFAQAMFYRRSKDLSTKQRNNWLDFFHSFPVTLPNRQQDVVLSFLKLCPGDHSQKLLEKVVGLNCQHPDNMSPTQSYNFYNFLHEFVIDASDPSEAKRSIIALQGGDFFALATHMIAYPSQRTERMEVMLDIMHHSPSHFVEQHGNWGDVFRNLPDVKQWTTHALAEQENIRLHQVIDQDIQPKERPARKI